MCKWSGVALNHVLHDPSTNPFSGCPDHRCKRSALVLAPSTALSSVPERHPLDSHPLRRYCRIGSRWSFRPAARLSTQLSGCRYSGAFEDFSGPRWWRAGLADMIAVNSRVGNPSIGRRSARGFVWLTSAEPTFLTEEHPVLAVDPRTMDPTRISRGGHGDTHQPRRLAPLCRRRMGIGGRCPRQPPNRRHCSGSVTTKNR